MCAWSAEVTEVLAEEVAQLSKFVVEKDVRASLWKAASPEEETAAVDKLHLLPNVLMLVTRLAIDGKYK